MFYPPHLSDTTTNTNNSTAASSETGASPSAQSQPQPSPETFPSWMFGEGWLDSQLSFPSPVPFASEEGAQGQIRPQLPPMIGYPPGAEGMGMMIPPWPMMPPHHFGGPGRGGGPWEGWQG